MSKAKVSRKKHGEIKWRKMAPHELLGVYGLLPLSFQVLFADKSTVQLVCKIDAQFDLLYTSTKCIVYFI
jgi:hypothetical protein